jgi:EmrB/QacA subfamily drug resistance transporter
LGGVTATLAPPRVEKASIPASSWWVLVAVALGSFMSGLDGSITNTVLPVIAAALNADVAAVQWVLSIYLLVLSGLLLAFGRLGDIAGHRRSYLIGFVIFVASSAACAFATSVGFLVAVRGVQAVGTAMLVANSPVILTNAFPEQRRGQALGFQVTAVYIGLAIGPLLGGWLTAIFGWPSIFLVNVPVGALALLLAFVVVPHDRVAEGRRASFDFAGAITFTLGLVLLIVALNQAHVWGWTSLAFVACLACSAVSLALFVSIERRSDSPMLDLRLFASRMFSASVVSATLNYIALFSMTFLLPFYLIQARGLSPAVTGVLLTAQPLVMAAVAPFSGSLSDRIGARLPATIGMLVIALGLFLLSRLQLETPLAPIAACLGLIGVGVGLFSSPNTSAALGAAPRRQRGSASGVLATARNLGMVLGIGMAGAIFTTMLAGTATPGADAVVQAADAGLLAGACVALLGAITSAVGR